MERTAMTRLGWIQFARMGLLGTILAVGGTLWLGHDRWCECHNLGGVRPDITSRLTSPRATLRTFFAAISDSDRDPARIEDAIACLDLSMMPASFQRERDAGRTATFLDAILRSLDVRSFLVTDDPMGSSCVLAESNGQPVTVELQADGAWRFSAETMKAVPALQAAILRRDRSKPEPAATDIPGEFRSPRATVHTFHDAMRRGDYEAAGRCFDLSSIPAPARDSLGPELAIKMHEIEVRLGTPLEQDLPDQPVGEPIQFLARREGLIGLDRVTSGDRHGEWLLHRATVRSIERVYDAVAPLPLLDEARLAGRLSPIPSFSAAPGLWVRSHLPGWCWLRVRLGRHGTLDAYQLLGLVLAPAGTMLFRSLGISALLALARLTRTFRGRPEAMAALARLLTPMSWLCAVGTVWLAFELLDLRQNLSVAAFTLLSLLRWAALSWVAYVVMDEGLNRMAASRSRRNGVKRSAIGDMLFPLVALMLRITVVLGTCLLLLQMFELNVATVVAGLGIGGIAVALAAQDSLKSVFGSLTLIFDRTFYVGDLVKIGDTEGKVEAVGLRSTRIRALDDALMTIPNAELTTVHVTNYGARRYRRFRISVTVEYTTPLDLLETFRDEIQRLIEAHPATRKEEYGVYVHALGDSAIEILVQAFFVVENWQGEMEARQSLTLQMLRLASRLGVEFAFPTQTLHLAPAETRTGPAETVESHHSAVPAPHFARATTAQLATPGQPNRQP